MATGDGDKLLSDLEWTTKLAEEMANLSRLKEVFALTRDRYAMFAQQYRVYYMALLNAGFTAEQALEIVKAHGWIPK